MASMTRPMMRRTPAAVAPIAAPAVAPAVSWRTESVCKMGDMVVIKAEEELLDVFSAWIADFS